MRCLITLAGLLVATGAAVPLGAVQNSVQIAPLERIVTLSLDRVPLKAALDDVARQAGVRLAYSHRVVPLLRPVTVRLVAVSVQVALDTLLRGTGAVPTVDATGQILLVKATSRAGPPDDPPGSIAGTVRDSATGTGLVGVTVLVMGTRFAALTDTGGRYTIPEVTPGTYRMRARRLGYTPADTSVVVVDDQQTVVDFRLQASAIELEQIVAIGYATAARRDLTGAVSSVSAEQFRTPAAPTVTLSGGLQGKAPGVQVTSNSGLPGAGLRVRIRGTGSITANSEPLYVIDGIPAEQGSNSSDPKSNPLMSIDPTEIESIDVLKDASATAIYGARGANGVVLISMRHGQRGQTRVSLETSSGFQEIGRTIPVLNAQDFMTLTNEARANAGRTALFTPTQIAAAQTYNYPAMILRTALQTNQTLTFSGGDQRLRYLASGNYTKQEGIEIGSDFSRYGVRVNLDADASPRLRIGSSFSVTRVSRNAPSDENGQVGNSANGIQAAMQFAPFQAPKDAAGKWIKQSPTTEPVPNPVANATELTDLNTTSRLLGSAFGEFDLTPSLRVRSTVAGNFQFDGIHFFAPRTILAGGLGGTGWVFSGQSRNLTNENTLTYRGTLGPGSMDVLGGFSVQRFASEAIRGDGANFPIDATGVYNLGSGSQLIAPSSDASESAIISYLGRANYNIAGKYLFTLTGRRDGSSVFGANHKWAFFPSGAFAWRLSDEDFMRRQSLVSDLKLRLSYGKVGSQAVGPYQSLSRLVIAWYSAGTTEIPAMAPSGSMPNPDLRWEQQSQFNAGLDAGLWNNRITLSFDAYRSTTKDLLLSVAVPSTTGFSSQLRNIGSVRNSGVELALTTVNVQGPRLTWRTTLSVAHNKNRVLDLGTTLDSKGNTVPLRQINVTPRTGGFFSPGDLYIIRVGQPLSAIYGYRVTGLWQPGDPCYLKNPAQNCVPGEYKIADIPDSLGVVDSVIDAKDRVILGSGDPKFYGGFGNSVTFGPFSLDAFFSFVYGNKIINAGNAYGCLGIMQANERTCTLDRWTPQHTNTTVPRLNNARPRSLYSTLVEDGSYLRLQTLTFGFQLPAALLPAGASSARLFITGQNLWTTTKYTGFDPDVNSMGGDPRFAGIDIGAYPRSRVWNFGLNLGF